MREDQPAVSHVWQGAAGSRGDLSNSLQLSSISLGLSDPSVGWQKDGEEVGPLGHWTPQINQHLGR